MIKVLIVDDNAGDAPPAGPLPLAHARIASALKSPPAFLACPVGISYAAASLI